MQIYLIDTPDFYVDGGAFFGVVPKTIWSSKYPADESNLCHCSCRSLLVVNQKKVILFDTGIGDKKLSEDYEGYQINYKENLLLNLRKLGFRPEDVTDVVLSHLHFDHCGGTTSVNRVNAKKYDLCFPNAIHYISESQWYSSINPNYRERSSFLKENFIPLQGTSKLKLVNDNFYLNPNVEVRIFNGHTAGMMLPIVKYNNIKLFFTGDLIPVKASIPLAWISAYDIYPLKSIEEKQAILQEAYNNNWVLVFQHDYYCECCSLTQTAKGVRAKESFALKDICSN